MEAEVETDLAAINLERITDELRRAAQLLDQQTGQRLFALDVRARPWRDGESTKAPAHARLQALFDGALNAILLADDHGAYVDANPAACALLGYSRDELLQLSLPDLMAEPERSSQVWRRFIHADHEVGRATLLRKDGRRLVVDYMATAHIQPGVHLSVLEDASHRVQTEASLVETRLQLEEVTAQQQERLDELRAELARELHDELGQLLGGLRLEADLVAALAPVAAEHMHRLLDGCTAAVRDLSRAQRPAALDLGLVPALQGLAVDFSRQGDVDIDLHIGTIPPGLPVPVVLMLFRVAQEGLGNAVRHAKAHHISLTLTCCSEGLELRVEDDGSGFDVERARRGPGRGLAGMGQRASRAAARLQIQSQPGLGTCLSLVVPSPVAGWSA